MNKKTESIQRFEYQAEMKQLLNLIIHSLYTHQEVFLRELISNACDALNKVRFRALTDKNILDSGAELKIKIELDSKQKTFSIEDNGIGMDEPELIGNLGTIARSGTLEFLKKTKEEQKPFDGSLIGQFGVGFYSVFMVSDEVIVETRRADADSKGYRWSSGGEGTYTIEEISKQERGTKIYFKLKDSADEFCHEDKVKEIINKYSNFADYPIFLGKDKINLVSALWYKAAGEIKQSELCDFYKFISKDFNDPLGHLQLSMEGAVNFKALIFVPKTAPFDLFRIQEQKSMHLYSNKILIQDDCKDLIPEYLRFVKGLVDTVDLPLNVSREVTQSSPTMGKIKNVLTGKILALLADWAENDSSKYEEFYKNFGPLFKTGINMDFTNRDKIIELLRFQSSLSREKMISFKDYISRVSSEQKEIYYLSGESRESLERNPNLEYFKKKGIEVLFLTDPVDIFIMPSISEYDKRPVKSIDHADIDLMPEDKIEKPDENFLKSLISVFKNALKDKVEDVVPSKRLVNSAVTLVSGKGGMDIQMERMMRMMDKDSAVSKKIMEVNFSHPLIKNLSKLYIADPNHPLLTKCILQLYEGALFTEGNLNSSADFVKRMTEIMEEATK